MFAFSVERIDAEIGKNQNFTNLMLANVEALASGESGQNVYCCGNYGDCMLILGGGVVKGIKFFSPCP